MKRSNISYYINQLKQLSLTKKILLGLILVVSLLSLFGVSLYLEDDTYSPQKKPPVIGLEKTIKF